MQASLKSAFAVALAATVLGAAYLAWPSGDVRGTESSIGFQPGTDPEGPRPPGDASPTTRPAVAAALPIHFTFSPTDPAPGDAVTFTVEAFDGLGAGAGQRALSHSWDFDDGSGSVEATPSHVFTTANIYSVLLTVTGEDGSTGWDAQTLVVAPRVPRASFTFWPSSPAPGDEVQFTASASDADGTVVSYSWDFDDGSAGTGADPTHAFATASSFVVRLTVRDDDGASKTFETLVQVAAKPPSVWFAFAPLQPAAGDSLTFTPSVVDPDGRPVAFEWDFGDGSKSLEAAPQHAFASNGRYRVGLTVTDDDGATMTVVRTILVRPSVTISFSPASPVAGEPVAFTAAAHGMVAPATYAWDFRDGAMSGDASPMHAFAIGSYSVRLGMTDNDGTTFSDWAHVVVS